MTAREESPTLPAGLGLWSNGRFGRSEEHYVAETSGGRHEAETIEVRDEAIPSARLREDDLCSCFQGAGQDGLAFTSDDDNFDRPSSGRDDRADKYVARDVGQAEITHDHVEVTAAKRLEGLVSITSSCDVGALVPEQHGEHVQNVGRVFDDEDLQASQAHRQAPECARMIDTSETEASCERNSSLILGFRRAALSLPLVDSTTRSTGIQKIQADALAVQLLGAAGLRDACDLDLLLFFSRHPRVVLSSERLAAYVGYDVVAVARALDLLLGAGLLKRTLNHGTPGRMYVLEVHHAEEWLDPLRQLCATPDGRNALRALLRERRRR